MREIKFRAWDGNEVRYDVTGFEHGVANEMRGVFLDGDYFKMDEALLDADCTGAIVMQYTGLKDKNGHGLNEVYEGDIIGTSSVIGNIYETNPREADLVIPRLGTKAWQAAYEEAMARGFDYAE